MRTVRQQVMGFGLILAVMLLVAGCDGDAGNGPVVQGFPKHDIGTFWTFDEDNPGAGLGTVTHTITGTQVYRGRELLVFSRAARFPNPTDNYDRIYLHDAKTGNIVVRDLHGATIEYEPDSGFYSFPMKVGKTWRATYTVREGQDEYEEWAEREVAAYERVTVPAGAFMAFRVSITAASYDNFDETYWYAPDVGYVVKLVAGEFVVELDDWIIRILTEFNLPISTPPR